MHRRAFATTIATLPFAPRPTRLDLPDLRVDPIALGDGEDVEILSISPDATTVVGIMNRDQICFYGSGSDGAFYETYGVERLSVSDPFPELGAMDTSSIRWSPDSSRIAFSLDAFRLLRDSDVFVADAASGSITNLTGEGDDDEAQSLIDATDVQVDMYPQWLDDTTLVFARHPWPKDEDTQASLVAMDIEGSEATEWADFDLPDNRFVTKPMVLLPDGRVVFAADTATERIDLYTVAAGEVPERVDTGENTFFRLIDANDTHALIHEPQSGISWQIALDGSEPPRTVNEIFGLEDDEPLASLPAFGPGPDSMVVALANANRTVSIYDGGRVREVAYLRGPETLINQIVWVPGRVLVSGRMASWAISHED